MTPPENPAATRTVAAAVPLPGRVIPWVHETQEKQRAVPLVPPPLAVYVACTAAHSADASVPHVGFRLVCVLLTASYPWAPTA